MVAILSGLSHNPMFTITEMAGPLYLQYIFIIAGEYRGDSSINVLGDLISCAVGFTFADRITRLGPQYQAVPLAVFGMLELGLAAEIRDNMILIITQLVANNQR